MPAFNLYLPQRLAGKSSVGNAVGFLLMVVAGLMLIQPGALFSAAMFISRGGQRHRHVDWYVPVTQMCEGRRAVHACCYRLLLQYGGMIFQ